MLKRSLLLTRINHGLPLPAEGMALLTALDPHHPVLLPADLSPYELQADARMRKGHDHPLRRAAERVAALLDVPAFDLYLHEVPGRGAGLEPTDPPSIILPWHALDWPEDEQVFGLASVLGRARLLTWLGARRSPQDLEITLAAATRIHVTGFAIAAVSDDTLDEQSEELSALLPRDIIDAFEAQAVAYARAPRPDFGAWLAAMDQAAARTGLLIGGDLEAALLHLRRSSAELSASPTDTPEQRSDLIRRSEAMKDLVRWHLSDDHHLLRRMARLDVR